MLCSNCSRKIKPIVAFDIDGTLGDYHGHLHRFAAEYLSAHPDSAHALLQSLNEYDGTVPHGEWFEDHGISRGEFRAIKLAYRQGSMKRTMPPFSGSIKAIQKVAERGVEVWLTTTRPYLRLDNVDPDTRWWVEKFDIPFDYMLYDECKYQELARRVDRPRVVAVVDDLYEMYDDAADVLGPGVPILYQTQYNIGVERPSIARGGRDLVNEVMRRIETYERHYG